MADDLKFNRWKNALHFSGQQLVGAVRAVGPMVKSVKAQLGGPFVADGVYGGIPYRVLPGGSIDAMMPGGMVRFRNMDHLLEAIDGRQKSADVPIIEPQKPTTQIELARGSNGRRSRKSGIALSIFSVLILVAFFTALNRSDLPVSPAASPSQ